MDFFFELDALQNYFSEILGIGISVAILPFLIRFYLEKKNRHLRYMFLDRVFCFSKHMIDNYLPAIFKEPWELQRSSNKKQGYDIFQSFKIINLDDEKIEIEIMNDLDKLSYPQFKLYTIELIKDFNDIEEEIGLADRSIKNKPFIALNTVSETGYTISETLRTKIEEIYE